MQKIKSGDRVLFNYKLLLKDGTLIETTEKKGKKVPIVIKIGEKEVVEGLEDALIGLQCNTNQIIVVTPEYGYGEYNKDLLHLLPQENIKVKVKKGDVLKTKTPNGVKRVVVTEVVDDGIKVDANHPLAGQSLVFVVDIVEILND